MGSGKTCFALLLAERLLERGLVKKVATNIKVNDPRFIQVDSYFKLVEFLESDDSPKLFILDEAGLYLDARNPFAKTNRLLRHIAFLLRKYRGKMIVISQRFDDIDKTYRELTVAVFHKISRKTAVLYSDLFEEEIVIRNIPKTSIKFNSYDIAEFKLDLEDLNSGEKLREVLGEKGFVSPRELAEYLGLNYRTILKMIKEGRLKAIRVNSRLRIPLSEVERIFNLKLPLRVHENT